MLSRRYAAAPDASPLREEVPGAALLDGLEPVAELFEDIVGKGVQAAGAIDPGPLGELLRRAEALLDAEVVLGAEAVGVAGDLLPDVRPPDRAVPGRFRAIRGALCGDRGGPDGTGCQQDQPDPP